MHYSTRAFLFAAKNLKIDLSIEVFRGKSVDIKNFEKPTKHPYGMLAGYTQASEKESNLAFALNKCIEKGEFGPVEFEQKHPSMVLDGLFSEWEEGTSIYCLTPQVLEKPASTAAPVSFEAQVSEELYQWLLSAVDRSGFTWDEFLSMAVTFWLVAVDPNFTVGGKLFKEQATADTINDWF